MHNLTEVAQTTAAHTKVARGDIEAVLRTESGRLALDIRRRGHTICSVVGLGAGQDLLTDVRGVEQRDVVENYTMRAGKQIGDRHVEHTEVDVEAATASGRSALLRLRVADDGVAWRYHVPAGTTVSGEQTRIVPAPGTRSWMLEYTTWYEAERFGADLTDLAPGDYGMPALIRADDDYALVTESDIDGRWCGSYLAWDGSQFAITPADDTVIINDDAWTPWRTVIAGDLAEIVASTLVEDLARPSDPGLASASWIRPGRGAWSWWSSQYSGADAELQLAWADYAGDRGWEHLLVDCGWDAAWVPELVERASARGVQVHLWSKWSDLVGPDLAKLRLWHSWGVAGIKVDFMESESQARHAWYADIMAAAAQTGLMVNFHGSTIPRGWARSQPHVMTHEGIRGSEYYTFMSDPLKATHNVIQPFTRNVIGSMDYTPVAFTAPGRETSDAHELALAIAYESSLTHFADAVESYAARPIAEHVLEEVSAVWDEVRLLDGDPDRFAAIARRRGDRWFIGVIAAGDPLRLDLDLSALLPATPGLPAPGRGGALWLVTDDGEGGLRDRVTTAPKRITLELGRNGGAVLVLAPEEAQLRMARPSPRRADLRATPALQTVDAGGTVDVELTYEPGTVDAEPARKPGDLAPEVPLIRLPEGWTSELAEQRPGWARWRVTAPDDADPGDLAVVTVGVELADNPLDAPRAPRLTHVRVQVPVAEGVTALETLQHIHARNGYGPVEHDRANGGGDPEDGAPLRVAGQEYGRGLGVSAPSVVDFAVAGAERFTAQFGVDDETPGATMCFEVWGDGRCLANGVHSGGLPPVAVGVDLKGVSVLSLRTPGGEAGKDAPHGDWINPELHR